MTKGNLNSPSTGWAESEFGLINFGDKRLSKRRLKIADSFSNSPERSIKGVKIGIKVKWLIDFSKTMQFLKEKSWMALSLKLLKERRNIQLF